MACLLGNPGFLQPILAVECQTGGAGKCVGIYTIGEPIAHEIGAGRGDVPQGPKGDGIAAWDCITSDRYGGADLSAPQPFSRMILIVNDQIEQQAVDLRHDIDEPSRQNVGWHGDAHARGAVGLIKRQFAGQMRLK